MRRSQEEINVHNQKIMNFFNHDRKGPKNFCNRTLSSQGQTFAIHDGVLACMSGYFDKLFTTEMKEKYDEKLELDTIPSKRLESVLDFIYTGDIELTEENVLQVLEDADYTQVNDLKSFCHKFMLGMVTPDNCLKFRQYAAQYYLSDVEKKTKQVIADSIQTIVQLEDFKELDVGDVSAIISLRGKDCEEAVFSAIVKWVNYNPHQREELFVKLFSQLDLSLMITDFLQQVSNEDLVRKNLECSNMLVDNFHKIIKNLSGNSYSTELLVIGGESSLVDCVVYDVKTKQSRPVQNLSPGRSGLTSTRVGRKVYVMGGDGKNCKVLDLDKNTWNKIPDMLEERQYCKSASVGDCVYVTGGMRGTSLATCEKFQISAGKWSHFKNMLHSRSYHGTVVFNNFLYCIGGVASDHLGSCERYDEAADIWTEISPINKARSGLTCVALGGKIYAIGGYDGKKLQTVEQYTPETNKWEYVSPLQTARNCPSACVIGDKIYVIGGSDKNGEHLKSVEVYDPNYDVWTICFEIQKPLFRGSIVAL